MVRPLSAEIRGTATLWCRPTETGDQWTVCCRAEFEKDGAWTAVAPEQALEAHVDLVTEDGWVGNAAVAMLWPGNTIDLGAIKLFRGDVGSGRVVDSAGAVVSGARVVVDARRFVVTDAEGCFALPVLPAGNHLLRVQAEGFLDRKGAIVVIVPGHGSHVPDIILERHTVIEVFTEDEDGLPIPSAWVIGTGDWTGSDPAVRAETDALGRAVCHVVEGRSFTGAVGARGFAPTHPLRFRGSQKVRLRREPQAPVTAVDAAGRSLLVRALAVEHRVQSAAEFVPFGPVQKIGSGNEPRAVFLRDGVFRVRVWTETGEGLSDEIRVADRVPVDEIRVTVARRVTPVLTVRDRESGQPVAGARVRIARPQPRPVTRVHGSALWVERYEYSYLGVSDTDGRIAVDSPLWERATDDCLAVEAPGLARALVSLSEYQRESIGVDLSREAEIRGTLIDQSQGRGVPGIRVVAYLAADESHAFATTDARGMFRIGGLPAGEHEVGACFGNDAATWPEGPAPSPSRVEGRRVEVAPGGSTDVRLVCVERPRAVLSVELRENGQPATGYTVVVEPHRTEGGDLPILENTSEVNPAGYAVFPSIPEGQYELFVVRDRVDRLHAQTVRVTGGTWENIRVDLMVADRVDGIVRHSQTGAGLAGVSVEIYSRSSSSPQSGDVVRRTTTDASGRYSFGRIPAGTAIVRCSSSGLGFATSDELVIHAANRISVSDLLLKPR